MVGILDVDADGLALAAVAAVAAAAAVAVVAAVVAAAVAVVATVVKVIVISAPHIVTNVLYNVISEGRTGGSTSDVALRSLVSNSSSS